MLDFILEDIPEMKRMLSEPLSHQATMAGMEATWWLDDHLGGVAGRDERDRHADAVRVPHNITSEMGLALLEVADASSAHPEVVAFLDDVEDEGFLDEMTTLDGGHAHGTRSAATSTGTACAASARSTSPDRAGASGRARSCR